MPTLYMTYIRSNAYCAHDLYKLNAYCVHDICVLFLGIAVTNNVLLELPVAVKNILFLEIPLEAKKEITTAFYIQIIVN